MANSNDQEVNSEPEVLVRVRLARQDARLIKRFEKVINDIGEFVEDMPWKADEVRKIQMNLKYIAKHLRFEPE